MTNQEIIDSIILKCSERVDKPLFLFEHILNERESLEFVEDMLYYQVAGLVLMLNPDGTDTSSDPTLKKEKYLEQYDIERKVILKYLLTLIHFEVKGKRDEARDNCIDVLKSTVLTFNKEFLNVLHLIILFDYIQPYTNLCKPLATFCADILYNEFNKLSSASN